MSSLVNERQSLTSSCAFASFYLHLQQENSEALGDRSINKHTGLAYSNLSVNTFATEILFFQRKKSTPILTMHFVRPFCNRGAQLEQDSSILLGHSVI